jgi:GT2 family glycosyltransferase
MGICQQLNGVIRQSAGMRLTFSSFGGGEHLDVYKGIPSSEAGWGVVGAKVLYSNGIVFAHGKKVVHKRGIRMHHANIGWAERDGAAYSGVRSCDSVTAHGFKISKAAWEAVGGFDEKFDAFYGTAEWVPDTLWLDDFCLRVRQAGWDVVCDGRWSLVDGRHTSIGEDARRFEHPIAQKLYRYWERKWGWHPEFPNLDRVRSRWGEEDPVCWAIGRDLLSVAEDEGVAVDVLVVTFNNLERFQKTIVSLANTDDRDIRLFVFDNGSSDGTADWIRNALPSVWGGVLHVETAPVNIGLPAAMNWLRVKSKEKSNAPLVARIDDDVLLPPEWLKQLRLGLKRDKYAGAIMPKICFASDPQIINFAKIEPWPEYNFHVFERDQGQYDVFGQVTLATGTCLLCRRKAWETAGPLDIGMSPSQTEDVDMTIAMQNVGYSIYYDGRVKVLHDLAGGMSTHLSPRARANVDAHEHKKRAKWGSDIHEVLERGLAEKPNG